MKSIILNFFIDTEKGKMKNENTWLYITDRLYGGEPELNMAYEKYNFNINNYI